MFNSDEVKVGTGVKAGINTNVDVEMVYAPMKEGNPPVLQFKIANTNFKRVFWEPTKGSITYERTSKYPFTFNGITVPKGKIMDAEENFAFDCMTLIQDLKTILKAVGIEAEFKAPNYDSLAKEIVKLFGGVKKADVKMVYDNKDYLNFAKYGFVAAPNSGTLSIDTKYDKVVKGSATAQVTSSGAAAEDLPF